MAELEFDRAFEPRHGKAVRLSPLVRRITAANQSPFTFHGTNTYLVGDRSLAVIDPGPDDPAHAEAILRAAKGAAIIAIVVTHTHRDHSPNARRLAEMTGAPTYGEGPHRPSRPRGSGETDTLDASGDRSFVPDHRLTDGAALGGAGWTLVTVPTPGHAANHLAFALPEENALFSGDHVMAWSTTVVAPPDGAMADYMASLDRLIQRQAAGLDQILWPGHGGPVKDPASFLPSLRQHRRERERAILDRLAAGDERIPAMVATIYRDVPVGLHGGAALSVLAHLEDLVARGLVVADGTASLDARYRPAGRGGPPPAAG
jgi:hydroxyacylglutathione hydrolase